MSTGQRELSSMNVPTATDTAETMMSPQNEPLSSRSIPRPMTEQHSANRTGFETSPAFTGRRSAFYCPTVLSSYRVLSGVMPSCSGFVQLQYRTQMAQSGLDPSSPDTVAVSVPLAVLCDLLRARDIVTLAQKHRVRHRTLSNETVRINLKRHKCSRQCPKDVSLFAIVSRRCYHVPEHDDDIAVGVTPREDQAVPHPREDDAAPPDVPITPDPTPPRFPPIPPTKRALAGIVGDFCRGLHPTAIAESACAICGTLSNTASMVILHPDTTSFACLDRTGTGITRREYLPQSGGTVGEEIPGAVLCASGIQFTGAQLSVHACPPCARAVRRREMPARALANGLWLGEVPSCLKELNFVEKLAVARYRHNVCVVKVDRGQRKLSANAVVFAQPVAKLYRTLPPPASEMGDCLVLMFTGSSTPTLEEFKRTPIVFRRDVVLNALKWLKDNHCDYKDLNISMENLASYPDNEPPVAIIHRTTTDGGAPSESLALYEDADERGTAHGQCTLSVHGLTSTEYASLSREAKIATALNHLRGGGGVLAYGRSSTPESIYKNPRLYPGMFPWLYPYGLGGFGNSKMTKTLHHAEHVRWKLMYHDRRFQEDEYFIFVVFNQQQIRDASAAGFALAQRERIHDIAEKIMKIDSHALQSIINRGKDGSYVTPENDAEKACFEVINMIDNVAGHVDGSVTKRKYMRNEIKSLMYQENVPLFFITFAPIDFKHPVCLYFCGEKIQLDSFSPVLPEYQDRMRAIARNPVACARFFDLIVRLFLDHVLGYGKQKGGVFGPVNAYYGTVESQGRLTLHLHLLIWITDSLSPQQIRDRILENDDTFKAEIKQWLEHCHQGEFSTGSMEDIRARIQQCKNSFTESSSDQYPSDDEDAHQECTGWRDPTTCLPEPPGDLTDDEAVETWFSNICGVVDEIVYLSNRHTEKHNKGCRRGPDGYCRARFPRDLQEETIFDLQTGAIRMKKGEQWINTFSIVVSYLLRCNTDVTSLLSGTQVKAVLAYVTDYITKHSLKTHVMFEAIKAVLDRKSEFISEDMAAHERARVVLTKIVNALTSKLEIGGPMIALHLLGLSDHYTSHRFKAFFWWSYRREVENAWKTDDDQGTEQDPTADNMLLTSERGEVVGISRVQDYIYRPPEFAKYSLYDYLRETDVKPLRSRHPARPPHPDPLDEPLSDVDDALEDDHELSDTDEPDESDVPDPSVGTFYHFHPDHPRHHSHAVVKLEQGDKWVLNFFGGAIPRRDRGDREEYCRTMLTFFIPWRSGRDLKNEEEDWSAAFDRQEAMMLPHHKKVMDNFHVLFECHDARDDFASQRRAESRWQLDSFPMHAEELERSRDYGDQNIMDEGMNDFLLGDELEVGKTTRGRLQRMHRMRDLLREGGWTTPIIDGKSDKMDTPFIHGDGRTGSQWKQLLAAAKQQVIDNKLANRPGTQLEAAPLSRAGGHTDSSYNVQIVHKEDLSIHPSASRTMTLSVQQHAEMVRLDYTLNYEQTRAYRMITTQLISRSPTALLMYLGGVGGTGKSRVLNACIEFLNRIQESHRFAVTAPTGSAACLIDGTTYQSLLGMGQDISVEHMSEARLAKVRSRIVHVDILFIDEVSMLSCTALHNISALMSKALDEPHKPFGGKSVVFAGDFAQLPPPGPSSTALYSPTVNVLHSTSSRHSQNASLGKALWHFVTKAVILRQNMRLSGMTEGDRKFATALDNMRYGACTEDDLDLLQSRIQGPGDHQPKLSDPRFRDVSIITAFNAERDAINDTGVERFAKQTGQTLQTFHSVDTATSLPDLDSLRAMQRAAEKTADPVRTTNTFASRLQTELWSLPPGVTDHHAGQLSLCVNMPVLLKQNEATELCATNGAEGKISGWTASTMANGTQCLETVFVKLTSPPRDMRIPHLPPNVVPINRTKKRIKCHMRSDKTLYISREQVTILPNFAMTDFCSQGRTRPNNVVDLLNCRNHQSIYTCLSRSSSLEGTLILQSFDTRKITKGIDRGLRQEMREWEIIDQVCEWQQNGDLEDDFPSTTRGALIQEFYRRWGTKFVPPRVHPALRWDGEDHITAPPIPEPWQLPSPSNKRRRSNKEPSGTPDDNKRLKSQSSTESRRSPSHPRAFVPSRHQSAASLPLGIRWDSADWSCAYDSFLMVVWAICVHYPVLAYQLATRYAPLASVAVNSLQSVLRGSSTAEGARNQFRDAVSGTLPHLFPRHGPREASASDLATHALQSGEVIGLNQTCCSSCTTVHHERPLTDGVWHFVDNRDDRSRTQPLSTSSMLNHLFSRTHDVGTCSVCHHSLFKEKRLLSPPPLLVLDFSPELNVFVDHQVVLPVGETVQRWLLAGIIYLGGHHFTASLFDRSARCFYYDGMVPTTVRPTHIETANADLSVMRGRRACIVVYVLAPQDSN